MYMGAGSRAKLDIMGIIKLKLAIGYVLESQEVSYVPSIRRNLLSISLLDSQGYNFLFKNNKVEMYKDGKVVGSGTLCGNLYRLDLFSNGLNYSVNFVVAPIVASKRPRVNDNFSKLWHKRLGHISRHRMERLVKGGILHNLDFSDFLTCVECVKGKCGPYPIHGPARLAINRKK